MFFLFGLCIETFDPDAEPLIAGVFALGFLLAGLTATISGVMALFNVVRGKSPGQGAHRWPDAIRRS